MDDRQNVDVCCGSQFVDDQIGQTCHFELTCVWHVAGVAHHREMCEHHHRLADARNHSICCAFIILRNPVTDVPEVVRSLRSEINVQGRDRARLFRQGSETPGLSPAPARVRSWSASTRHGRVRGFRRCRRFYAGMGRLWLPCWNGIKFRAWMQIGEPTSRLHPKIAAGPFVRAFATVQNLPYTKYALQLHIVPVMFGPQVCGEI